MAGRLRVLLAAAAVALVAAGAAGAHARLVTTEPGDDAVVQAGPGLVRLRFSEPVETAFGAIRVYDSAARRVDAGAVARPSPETVEVGLRGRLARGTYTVTWRVVSADSHPVAGAFVFHVQEPGANPAGVAAQVLGRGTPPTTAFLLGGARALAFALLLLLAGGLAALALVLDAAAGRVRSAVAAGAVGVAAALVVVSAAGIVLQGAAAGGFGVGEALHPDVARSVLETRFGRVWLAQGCLAALVGLLALAAVRRGGRGASAAAAVAAAPLVALPAAAGHASVSGVVATVADVAHVAAGALWLGGLAALVLALLASGAARWELATSAVPRFSALAVGAVAVLVAAGTATAYLQVRALRGLWETAYGQLLLAKLALVLPLLALGLYNNRVAVPRLRSGLASALERTRFLRVAVAELALFAGVVGVTAVLASEPPARAAVAPREPYATLADLGGLELNLVADPAAAGPNAVHLYLTDRSGRPAEVAEATVSASLPSRSIGPLRLEARRAGPGHYVVPRAQLALAGTWQLRVHARRGELESLDVVVPVPIREER